MITAPPELVLPELVTPAGTAPLIPPINTLVMGLVTATIITTGMTVLIVLAPAATIPHQLRIRSAVLTVLIMTATEIST